MPGFPVLHYLLDFAQTHAHWVGDGIQPSHPLSSPSPPALNLSWYQGLFHWVHSLHQVAKVLELQLQHQSFQWIFSPLGLTCLISLLSKGISSVFSSTTIWKHQFFVTQPFFGPTITSIHDYWKNHSFDYMDFCQQSDVSVFNVLSRFVTAFLPRSKCLLISWLQPPSAVILEPRKIKSVTVPLFPFYLSWSDGTGCHDLSFLNFEF